MMEEETEDIDVFLLEGTNSLLFFNRGGGRKFLKISGVRFEVLVPFRWYSDFLRVRDIWEMSAFWGTEYFFPRQIIWEDECFVLSEEEGFGMIGGAVQICREGADEWVAMMINHMNYPINYLEILREQEEDEEEDEEEDDDEEGLCLAHDLVEFLEYLPEPGVRVSMSQYKAIKMHGNWFEKFNQYAKFMELPKRKNDDDNWVFDYCINVCKSLLGYL